ncbi:MAG: hypothetical protein K2V38_12500, partial [Gemmataceae bacterium]|nr:hypothetical protein [Gemmataceae bacterium]
DNPKNKDLTELLSLWKQGVQPANPGAPLKLNAELLEKLAKAANPDERGKIAIPPADQLLMNRVEGVCLKCHTHDTDPHFELAKYWPKVKHSGLAPPGGWPAVAPPAPPKK